jgi:hypothetical protein
MMNAAPPHAPRRTSSIAGKSIQIYCRRRHNGANRWPCHFSKAVRVIQKRKAGSAQGVDGKRRSKGNFEALLLHQALVLDYSRRTSSCLTEAASPGRQTGVDSRLLSLVTAIRRGAADRAQL